MTNNLCTSYFGCYQMNIVLPGGVGRGGGGASKDSPPSTFTAIAACIESRSQNNTHCGPDQLYRQSSPNTQIKCCSNNLCNDINDVSYSIENQHLIKRPQKPYQRYGSGGNNPIKSYSSGSSLNMKSSYTNNINNNNQRNKQVQNTYDTTERNRDSSLWTSDFWFRIAVITVPITGAVILVFLIIVAIKLLRQEDLRHKMLAQQKMQTLSALHRGCTEHYCHLTGSIASQSDADVSKCDKLLSNKSPGSVCQYSPTRQIPPPLNGPYKSSYNTSSNPSHLMPTIISSGNLSPYAKCDTIQVKPVVTRPPDICECHSPGIGPAQILANPRSSANTRPFFNHSSSSNTSVNSVIHNNVYRIQSNANYAVEHV